MKTFSFKKFFDSGSLFIWLCGGALGISLLMIGGLLVVVLINGMGYFWPKDLIQLTLKNGEVILGEWVATEIIPETESVDQSERQERVQLKVGNRDLYGLDFRWVDVADIAKKEYPSDVVTFERREWGNFYGRIQQIHDADTLLASGHEKGMSTLANLLKRTNALQEKIDAIEHDEIAELNHLIEQARLRLRSLEMSAPIGSEERVGIKTQLQELEVLYEVQNSALIALYHELEQFRMTVVDVAGAEKSFLVGSLVNVWSPNSMGLVKKF